jgi:S-adenosylmethionine synthetase
VAGEFRTRDPHDLAAVHDQAETLVRRVLRDTGYTTAASGIDPDACEVQIRFNGQSGDINQGVDRADGILGAGDQGLMFGYACDETPELMPAPIVLAHKLLRRQAELRRSGRLPWLRPDAKSQVSFRYEDGRPVAVETVVFSTQHDEDVALQDLQDAVRSEIIDPLIPADLRSTGFRTLINPTGRFVTGGPRGDVGLTGRKIIVDTYGGAAPHGGGAFSGKDPSKVDRSGAYMARYLAKTAVARGWTRRCLVQLSYAIGVAEPVSFLVQSLDTVDGSPGLRTFTSVPGSELASRLAREFDLTPAGIIAHLGLAHPLYYPTAAYGHFGRTDGHFPWEEVQ